MQAKRASLPPPRLCEPAKGFSILASEAPLASLNRSAQAHRLRQLPVLLGRVEEVRAVYPSGIGASPKEPGTAARIGDRF
jgi:hypothetical protein